MSPSLTQQAAEHAKLSATHIQTLADLAYVTRCTKFLCLQENF